MVKNYLEEKGKKERKKFRKKFRGTGSEDRGNVGMVLLNSYVGKSNEANL